jgi:hypothetical protein
MSRVEYAEDGSRRVLSSVFPKRWGAPPLDDERRHAWIAKHAREETAYRSGAAPVLAESREFWAGIHALERLEAMRQNVRLLEMGI